MNTRAESPTSQTRMLDYGIWAVVVALLGAAIAANWYFADLAVIYRALGVLAVLIAAGAIGFQTAQGRALWTLFKEARVEIRRVVWPTQVETRQTTVIVVILVFIVALIMWMLDAGLGFVVSRIIG